MPLDSWSLVLAQSFQEVWLEIAKVVPNVLIAIIIFLIGWLVGAVLGGVVSQICRSLRFDKALERPPSRSSSLAARCDRDRSGNSRK